MKFKNVVAGLPVQVKKGKCPKGFHPDMQYEVLRIEQDDNEGKNILVQHGLWLGWFNHRDLKKATKPKPDPELKQLDHSIFDGLDEKWKFAAVDAYSGRAYVYDGNPAIRSHEWVTRVGVEFLFVDQGYDTSNWRNSLIERNTAIELSGSELCKAMLDRGDTRIMCRVYDIDRQHDITHVIRAYSDGKFHTKANRWTFAIPINNKGEPLTAKDVGLQQGNT